MARISITSLRSYLLSGHIPVGGCLRRVKYSYLARQSANFIRCLRTTARRSDVDVQSETSEDRIVPFRKQLKDEAKTRKSDAVGTKAGNGGQSLEQWELTVGIEIHAQLNTERKLFSAACSTINDAPNTRVAPFDVAMPGSLPRFQKETLIPALRAALALNCDVQNTSRFDRKHYFHWDQPSGYQITQYYEPFAKDGYITLYAHDGIAEEDGDQIRIGIKQIQMEQDTAKTVSEPGGIHLLDFNRVGLPLIEIVTLPQIHHSSTAAALVRKIQVILNSVDACVLGMQSGGLRADVNVSVRRRDVEGINEYSGVKGLGQRTEIKNLSSFKAVEDAIIAERNRQIDVLEAGGKIEGETRGWTIGSTETVRLRGKEGEVDYRYMPDPDLGPVIIGKDVIDHVKETLGVLPDTEMEKLVNLFGLSGKDALSLVALNDGFRAEYFYNACAALIQISPELDLKRIGKLVGNWVLHELGGLNSPMASPDDPLQMTEQGESLILYGQLAQLLNYLELRRITGNTAKKVLGQLYNNAAALGGNPQSRQLTPDEIKDAVNVRKRLPSVKNIIESNNWWFDPFSTAEYEELVRKVINENPEVIEDILAGKRGKTNFLLGQMMRQNNKGRMDAQEAMAVLQKAVEAHQK